MLFLHKLNADEKVKQEAFYREKRLHDEASALGTARREGRCTNEFSACSLHEPSFFKVDELSKAPTF